MSSPSRNPLLILTPSPVYAPPPFGLPVLRRLDGAHDGQLVQRGERPVALVLGRHGHDRPGAVAHEDVVGHVERDGLAVERVDHVAAREGAALLERARIALGHALDVGLRWPHADGARRRPGAARPVVSVSDERMLGRHDGVGHAEAGVGAGGEDAELQLGRPSTARSNSAPSERPIQLRCMTLARSRPLEIVEGVEELVGVLGDPEEPLLEVALLDQVARALAGAVGQHLLVGENGLAARAPVDRRLGPVGQARLAEPQEDRSGST